MDIIHCPVSYTKRFWDDIVALLMWLHLKTETESSVREVLSKNMIMDKTWSVKASNTAMNTCVTECEKYFDQFTDVGFQ
jgi:hypothetical protein